ncbi:MAG: PIN domain-containing protein [Muribaculaceae bacterium]|nr:PIN domain-containing protein [Muribaculaceae bacterium]
MKEEEGQTKRICVVLDTNVLVAALITSNPMSPTAQIITFFYKGILKPVYNDKIIEEYLDVLNRKHFNFNPKIVEELINTVQALGLNIKETVKTDEIFQDPDDIVFYEVRMSVEDSYLVTGNQKHFPVKPFVVTPKQMLEILKEKNLI